VWIGVRRPLIVRITIGRPQQQLFAVHTMAWPSAPGGEPLNSVPRQPDLQV
jgi:hypothetical protein